MKCWRRPEPRKLYEWVDEFGEIKGSMYDSPEEAEFWRRLAQDCWPTIGDSPAMAELLDRWELREMKR